MSDDAARYLDGALIQRDEWRRVAWEQVTRSRRIVLMLAQRKRQARRDVKRARALPEDSTVRDFLLHTYESTYTEAHNAHELARRILMGYEP